MKSYFTENSQSVTRELLDQRISNNAIRYDAIVIGEGNLCQSLSGMFHHPGCRASLVVLHHVGKLFVVCFFTTQLLENWLVQTEGGRRIAPPPNFHSEPVPSMERSGILQ